MNTNDIQIRSVPVSKQQIKYMWIDEDGEQVSPVHAKFGTALNFINGWHERVGRLREKWGPDFDLTRPHSSSGYTALSKSGKPPVQLVRLVVREVQEELTEQERAIVESMTEIEEGQG